MLIAIALAKTSIISHNYYFFFMVRTFKVYSLNYFGACNTLLLTIITIVNYNQNLFILKPEVCSL